MDEHTTAGAFSIAEFCRAYSISRSTAYTQIRSGRLATFKCGRRRLVSVSAAEAWRGAHEAETAAARAA